MYYFYFSHFIVVKKGVHIHLWLFHFHESWWYLINAKHTLSNRKEIKLQTFMLLVVIKLFLVIKREKLNYIEEFSGFIHWFIKTFVNCTKSMSEKHCLKSCHSFWYVTSTKPLTWVLSSHFITLYNSVMHHQLLTQVNCVRCEVLIKKHIIINWLNCFFFLFSFNTYFSIQNSISDTKLKDLMISDAT